MRAWLAIATVMVVCAVGCDAPPAPLEDAGSSDAGRPLDAGSADAGSADASAGDAGSIDASTIDAGELEDAGADDAGELDGGLDASLDAGADAGLELDAGSDAGSMFDAGCAGPEIPGDGIDGDCDGMERCYVDRDGDGYRGSPIVMSPRLACDGPSEASAAALFDCHDLIASVHPGAPEVCDGHDDDCDGTMLAGEEDEGDGYLGCTGFVDVDFRDAFVGSGDCDSLDPTRYQELGRYPDRDLDGFGVPSLTTICMGTTSPAGWSDVDTDCDDADAFDYPGAPEIPADGIDQGCAGDGDLIPDDSNAIFVNGACTSGCGAGTRASPVTTIGAGVSLAGSSRVVLVAEGVYAEGVATGASLFGGYSADFSARDPDTYVTSMSGVAATGRVVVQGFTFGALAANPGSELTALDNVVETSGSGSYTRALAVHATPLRARGNVLRATGTGASTDRTYAVDLLVPGLVYLEDNVIEAFTTSNGHAVAVHARLQGALGVLIGNSVRGSDAPPSTSRFRAGYAIEWEDTRGPTSSWLHLVGNEVRGGDRARANAIYLTYARLVAIGNYVEGGAGFDESYALQHYSHTHTTAVNNVFVAGTADASTGEAFAIVGPSHGVFVNNTILGGSAGSSRGVLGHPGYTVWVNNLIFSGTGTGAYGMDLSRGGLGTREVVLAFNDFYGASMDAMVRASSGGSLRTAAEVDACTWIDCVSATGTIGTTPSFVGGTPFDYHVTSAIAGGDPTPFYAGTLDDTDVDGDARPGADGIYAVGADEGP